MLGDLLKPETFEFFAKYVLAGFVIILVANAFVIGRKPRPAEAALEIVLYSLLNQLMWLAIGSIAALMRDSIGIGWSGPSVALQFYSEVLILPILIGSILGIGLKRRWLHPVLRALSLPIVDPYPRAYDHVFAEFEGQSLVIVAYADGKNIYGLFGYQSRAGRDPNHSEIFVEQLYEVDDLGQWTPSSPPRSALVSLDGMRAIEFIPITNNPEVQDGTQTNR